MSGEERRLACTHAHVLRNNPRVQSEMKRGVKQTEWIPVSDFSKHENRFLQHKKKIRKKKKKIDFCASPKIDVFASPAIDFFSDWKKTVHSKTV